MSKVTVKEAKKGTSPPVLYAAKPVPVEAFQFLGFDAFSPKPPYERTFEGNYLALADFIAGRGFTTPSGSSLIVRTPGSTTTLRPGDWLLYSQGNFTSFDDAAFHAAYEKKRTTT